VVYRQVMFKSSGFEFKQFDYSPITVVGLFLVFTWSPTYLFYALCKTYKKWTHTVRSFIHSLTVCPHVYLPNRLTAGDRCPPDVMPCGLADHKGRLGGICYHHLQADSYPEDGGSTFLQDVVRCYLEIRCFIRPSSIPVAPPWSIGHPWNARFTSVS
jgi:hypothetical protein